MERVRISESELRFCEILWSCEPIGSSELCKKCAETLGWKKSTVYTVIKRLCGKSIIKSENAQVSSLVGRSEAMLDVCLFDIERTYGDVPSFLYAYLASGDVSDEDKAKTAEAAASVKSAKRMPSYLL